MLCNRNHPSKTCLSPVFYLFILAFFIRLAVGFFVSGQLDSDFAKIAQNVAGGKGYSMDGIHPTALWSPAYPLILAIVFKIFGQQQFPLIIITAVIGALNACLCAVLGRKIFNRPAGLIAGVIYAATPYLAQKESGTEIGFVAFGLLAGLFFLSKTAELKKISWVIASAMMFSFAYLVRPGIGLIVMVIFFFILFIKNNAKPFWNLTAAGVFAIVFLIGISPWTIRNKLVFNRWYSGQTFFWYDLYLGNNQHTFEVYPGQSLDSFTSYFPIKDIPPLKDEFAQEEWFHKRSLFEIKRMGAKKVGAGSLRKLGYLWSPRLVPLRKSVAFGSKIQQIDRSNAENLLYSIPFIFLAVFSLAGLWKERQKKWLLYFTILFLAAFSLPHMALFAYSRYTTQVYFILILLASRGLQWLIEFHSLRHRRLLP